jgi:branched-chain amino acid transport system ATP-binding protein
VTALTAQRALQVEDVTVRFGGVAAVSGASLTAEPGEVTGLIGPNGAGKTTLFNVISGLQRPNGGRVRFGNEDITRLTTHQRARRGIARTFQRLEAFGSLSVRENVLVAAENSHRRGSGRRSGRQTARVVRDLVGRVGLAPFADKQADSVPTGIARLLELARALAIDPWLLLLDEPSSGLSVTETREFGDLLRELAGEGRGVLLVEHDMDLIMGVCDRIHVLDFGRVIASGPPAAIRADDRVQKAYLGETQGTNGDDLADAGTGADGGTGAHGDGTGGDGTHGDGTGGDGTGGGGGWEAAYEHQA